MINLPIHLQPRDFMQEMKKCVPLDPVKLQYRETFVALVDILGYKNLLIEHADNAPQYIYQTLQHVFSWVQSMHKSLDFTLFSDTLIITGCDKHALNFWNIANSLSIFQFELLKQGYLVRGAITYGKHFFENGILISPALVEAYNKEKTTEMPRIVIDSEALSKANSDVISELGKNYLLYDKYKVAIHSHLIFRDFDQETNILSFIPSQVELDYLKYDFHPDQRNINMHRQHCIDQGNLLLEKLKNNILQMYAKAKSISTEDQARIIKKIEYMIMRWNYYVSDFKNKHFLIKSYSI